MSQETVERIDKKLSGILIILAKGKFDEMKNSESAPKLRDYGLSNEEIAEIIGSTAESVRVTLSNIDKKGG